MRFTLGWKISSIQVAHLTMKQNAKNKKSIF